MITTPHGLLFRLPSGAAFLVLTEPGPCKRCKAAHYFFVNRNGETLCSACDGGDPEGLPAGLSAPGAAPSRVVGADAAFIRGFAHTRARCSECGEHPDPSDPALSNGVCCFCGGIPLGLEREEFRKRRRPKR